METCEDMMGVKIYFERNIVNKIIDLWMMLFQQKTIRLKEGKNLKKI